MDEETDQTEPLTNNRIQAIYYELADELGYYKETIEWVHYGLRQMEANAGEEHRPLSAKDICKELIRDFVGVTEGPTRQGLEEIDIHSSKDIGKIVFGLAARELIETDAGDKLEDFDGIFRSAEISIYLKQESINAAIPRAGQGIKKLAGGMYIVGLILVIGSYVDLVPNHIAWAGWAIGMLGFVLHRFQPRPASRFKIK